MQSVEELYQKWLDAFAAQENLEAKMERILKAAENREDAEKRILQRIAHDIDAARGQANEAWKKYKEVLNAELADTAKFLAEMQKDLNKLGKIH